MQCLSLALVLMQNVKISKIYKFVHQMNFSNLVRRQRLQSGDMRHSAPVCCTHRLYEEPPPCLSRYGADGDTVRVAKWDRLKLNLAYEKQAEKEPRTMSTSPWLRPAESAEAEYITILFTEFICTTLRTHGAWSKKIHLSFLAFLIIEGYCDRDVMIICNSLVVTITSS